ncbi:acetyltransferase [Geomonas oryzisoli]|uniref:Acetyltransferase n=1 Tax=Geomonas oryzisoli TaxID=2847992 RepID=A0ABX8JAA9_9BACT|nr:acetyltransferase [Geomonas oryzisoli]QWV93642.1 acetyltransferase [Geomonas oryzisoli]
MHMVPVNTFPPSVILYGGTGQAKIARPIIEQYGARVVAVFDDTPGLPSPFPGTPIYPGAELPNWLAQQGGAEIGFSVTIGNPHGRARLAIHDRLKGLGLVPVSFAHPTAFIDESAVIGEGAQISAGAIVLAEARLGRCCIINTKASVDHEDVLEDGAEVAPGATLCGLVRLGQAAWVCAGATVLPRLTIGADAIVGAGAVVTRDIPDGATAVGVPARPITKSERNPK